LVSNLKNRVKRAALAALAAFLLAGIWVYRSEPYRIALETISDPQLQSRIGDLRFHWLVRASLNYSEGGTSRISFYLCGTKECGRHSVWFKRHDGNFSKSRVLFNGKEFATQSKSE